VTVRRDDRSGATRTRRSATLGTGVSIRPFPPAIA